MFLLLINYKERHIKPYTVTLQHYALKKSTLSSMVQIQITQSCINESKGGKFLSIVDSLITSITIPYCDNLQRYCILFRDTGAQRTSQIFIRCSCPEIQRYLIIHCQQWTPRAPLYIAVSSSQSQMNTNNEIKALVMRQMIVFSHPHAQQSWTMRAGRNRLI